MGRLLDAGLVNACGFMLNTTEFRDAACDVMRQVAGAQRCLPAVARCRGACGAGPTACRCVPCGTRPCCPTCEERAAAQHRACLAAGSIPYAICRPQAGRLLAPSASRCRRLLTPISPTILRRNALQDASRAMNAPNFSHSGQWLTQHSPPYNALQAASRAMSLPRSSGLFWSRSRRRSSMRQPRCCPPQRRCVGSCQLGCCFAGSQAVARVGARSGMRLRSCGSRCRRALQQPWKPELASDWQHAAPCDPPGFDGTARWHSPCSCPLLFSGGAWL